MNSSSLPAGKGLNGYLLVLFSAIMAGAAAVIGKWNLTYVSPILMLAFMFGIGGVTLTAFLVVQRGWQTTFSHPRPFWIWLGLFTLTSWLAVYFFWTGLQLMDPSLAAFLGRSEVPVSIILALVLLRERFNLLESAGVLMSLAGIVVMKFTMRADFTDGFWWVLLGSLFFGITEYVSKLAVRFVEPIVLTAIRNIIMGLGFWIVVLLLDSSMDGVEIVWPGLIAIGIVAPVLSRVTYMLALKRLELSKVAIVSQTQPVFVLIIAILTLHQAPTLREVIGGVCISIGCLIMIFGRYQVRRCMKSV